MARTDAATAAAKWHRKFEGMGPHLIAPSAVAPASREQCEPGGQSVTVSGKITSNRMAVAITRYQKDVSCPWRPLETAAEDRNGSGRWPNFSRRPLAAAA
jgi:hypothetical protein